MILDMIRDSVRNAVDAFASDEVIPSERNYEGLADWVKAKIEVVLDPKALAGGLLTSARDAARGSATRSTADQLEELIFKAAEELHAKREKDIGAEPMRGLERFLLLQKFDEKWKDHLHMMDQLRSGIALRGYAQVDPKIAYKKEGFELFDAMIQALKEEVTRLAMHVEAPEPEMAASAGPKALDLARLLEGTWRISGYSGPTDPSEAPPASAAPPPAQAAGAPFLPIPPGFKIPAKPSMPKVGRNDPCPCGSGKKYKKCHGA
jgi:preprotein translocase subunit SecA